MAGGVLYVGTDDGLAVYREEGRGVWRPGARALPGARILAIVAADAETLLVAVEGGAPQQSFDGGATWGEAGGPPPAPIGLQVSTIHGPAELAFPRLAGATAYARSAGQQSQLIGAGAGGMLLFRSYDGGIHWEPARMPDEPVGSITALTPDPAHSGALWGGSGAGALLRSDDHGATWRVVAREPAPIRCLAAALT